MKHVSGLPLPQRLRMMDEAMNQRVIAGQLPRDIGPALADMADAADEIEYLYGLLAWCRPRLRHPAYRESLDRMIRERETPDRTPIIQS